MTMRKILLLLSLLFLFSLPAYGNVPRLVQSCEGQRPNAFSSTIECNLPNTTNGNIIIVKYSNFAASETWTSTETLTFPSGAQSSWNYLGFPRHAGIGYVVTTSGHADFHVKYADSGSNVNSLIVEEWAGIGSIDSSSATQATSGLSVSVTTAANNEKVFIACSDGSAADIQPGSSSITQDNSIGITNVHSGNANYRAWSGSQIFATATTASVSCTATTGTSAGEQISALAFAISSPPATPTINILQQCGFNFNNGGDGGGGCSLSNTLSGSTIIAAFTTHGTATQPGPTGTETFTCDSGTFLSHTYSSQLTSVIICYVKTGSAHAKFTTYIDYGACGGCVTPQLYVLEIAAGSLAASSDSGSATAYAAQSGSYSPTNANEPTFMLASDRDASAGVGEVLTPNNSFLPITGIWTANTTVQAQQSLLAAKVSSSSGSQTASWSYTNTNSPMTSVEAWGPVITFVGYPVIY